MGGNALKNVVTRRYARDEYYILKQRILNKLQGHIDQYHVPKEFPSKESFGDLDVLLVCPSSIKIRNLIQELFQWITSGKYFRRFYLDDDHEIIKSEIDKYKEELKKDQSS